MMNFEFCNPVRIVFGKGEIARLRELINKTDRVMMLYGGGSIKKNGVYDQVVAALSEHDVIEFSGIEPNPQYATCMKAVTIARKEQVGFLLAVGGGSVLDATKFIAAAALYKDGDPWDILLKQAPVKKALPLGDVMTLPATGSEMNAGAVISRAEFKLKLFFGQPAVYPKFSILDPETTYTLPPRQTANGIVDAYVHVIEQYLTFPANAPLQDRLAEAILLTLIEEGPKVLADPQDYDARATIMWAATNGLNGYISLGVPQDWATHLIGHEITAEYGLDHAQSLAVVLPGTMRVKRDQKRAKLLQYAERIFGLTDGSEDERIDRAIAATEEFFRAVGQKTKLSEYNIGPEACDVIAKRISMYPFKLGEHGDIGEEEARKILKLRV